MEKIPNFDENSGENLLSKNEDTIKDKISYFDAVLDFEDNYSDETSTIAFVKFIKKVFPKFKASGLKIYDIQVKNYQGKTYLIIRDDFNNIFYLPMLLSIEETRTVIEYINTFLIDYNIGRIVSNENGIRLLLNCTLQEMKNAYYMELQRLEYLTNQEQTKYDR